MKQIRDWANRRGMAAFRILLALSLSAGAAVPASAAPATRQAALVDYRVASPLLPAVTETFLEAIHAGLSADLDLMSLHRVRAELLARGGPLRECRTPVCLKDLSALLGARVLLQADLSSEASIYRVGLVALDPATGEKLLSRTEECPICTLDEATELARTLATSTGKELAERIRNLPPLDALPRPVAVASSPPGATLSVDGKAAGRTEATMDLAPGEHEFSLTLEGYEPFVQRVTIPADQEEVRLVFTLTPLPGTSALLPPQEGPDLSGGPGVKAEAVAEGTRLPEPSPRPERTSPAPVPVGTLSALGAGGGAAITAIGGVLLALHNRPTCSTGPIEACPTLYDTGNAGLAMVGIGGALVVGAGLVYILSR